uniref:Breast carcinoma amplified sequence 4 n=1 Tax=Canis lupus familiaris TaxID=9615 RepID=A0A8C0SBS4_CANLF
MKVPEFKIATRYYFYSSRKDVFLHSRLFCCGSDGSCHKQQALGKHLSRDKWVKRGAFRCRAAGTGPAQKRLVSPPWSRTVWPGAKEVEETIEGMLLRLEEFCSLTDMIRSDTSQILEENIPLLQAKVTEMRGIYARVDQLEAFVKMVGHHVSLLEAHVLQAERDHGAFSRALRRWLGSTGLPSFGNDPAWVWLGMLGPEPLISTRPEEGGSQGLPVLTCSRKYIPARGEAVGAGAPALRAACALPDGGPLPWGRRPGRSVHPGPPAPAPVSAAPATWERHLPLMSTAPAAWECCTCRLGALHLPPGSGTCRL